MKKRLSERRLLGAVCFGFLLSTAPIVAAPDTSGFALGSRVNIRAMPSVTSTIVKTINIGTPVRWHEPQDGWCKVTLVDDNAVAGYVRCDYLAAQKQTLEAIDKELSNTNLTVIQENDLLERRFFLSPSLNTIAVARQRKKMEADDNWLTPIEKGEGKPYCIQIQLGSELLCIVMQQGSDDFCIPNYSDGDKVRCDEVRKGAAAKRSDYEFIGTLMNGFQGEVKGEDFRPVDLRINEHVISNLQSNIGEYKGKEAVGRESREIKTTRDVKGALPKVGRSLFVDKRDVLAAGVMDTWSYAYDGDEIKSKWVTKPNGKWDSTPIDSLVWSFNTSSDVIEFSKLIPGQRFQVRHFPLKTVHGWFHSYFGWYKTGGVEVEFAKPPQAVMVTNGRLTSAQVLRAQIDLTRGYCGGVGKLKAVTVKLSEQIRSSGVLLLLAPHVRVSEAKIVSTDTNLVIYDLNGDGNADVAYARLTTMNPIGGTDKNMFVFLNIDGSWRLGAHEYIVACD